MTLEWSFPSVFPYMSCKMLTSCETEVARWISTAEETLSLLLLGSITITLISFVVRAIQIVIRCIYVHCVRLLFSVIIIIISVKIVLSLSCESLYKRSRDGSSWLLVMMNRWYMSRLCDSGSMGVIRVIRFIFDRRTWSI